jgi:valyl-tRNA synthetase
MNLVDNFGADATRFGLIFQTAWGQDMSFQESRILTGKKFCNKIWNASRFVIMNLSDVEANSAWGVNYKKDLTDTDKKILAKFAKITKEVEKNIKKYRFGQAIKILYDFFWHDFCDRYIETAKNQMQNKKQKIITHCVLFEVLENSLKILHPFIPFATEEIWQELKATNSNLFKKYYNYKYRQVRLPKALVIAAWPKEGN